MIFSPAASDDYQEQRRLLQDQGSGFEERDLLTTVFLETDNANAEAAGARAAHNVEAGGFAVVLIGRDGTQKYRSNTPVTAPSLFEKIDAMPMRRREMGRG